MRGTSTQSNQSASALCHRCFCLCEVREEDLEMMGKEEASEYSGRLSCLSFGLGWSEGGEEGSLRRLVFGGWGEG
jgi:hypothetical protein